MAGEHQRSSGNASNAPNYYATHGKFIRLASYLVTMCRLGVTVLSGGAGEIENVNQVFQPDGRFAASNSP